MIEYVYTHERCHIFALALSQVFGYEMRFLWDLTAKPDKPTLIHAYCVDPYGFFYDARGKVMQKTVHQEFQGCNKPQLIKIIPDRVHHLMTITTLNHPFDGELEKLIDYIKANSQLYMR
jgi:hypothetical protein